MMRTLQSGCLAVLVSPALRLSTTLHEHSPAPGVQIEDATIVWHHVLWSDPLYGARARLRVRLRVRATVTGVRVRVRVIILGVSRARLLQDSIQGMHAALGTLTRHACGIRHPDKACVRH